MENVLESSRQPRIGTQRAVRDRESLDSQASAVVPRTDGSYLQRLRRKPRGDPNTGELPISLSGPIEQSDNTTKVLSIVDE
jgi:hypothetical protein